MLQQLQKARTESFKSTWKLKLILGISCSHWPCIGILDQAQFYLGDCLFFCCRVSDLQAQLEADQLPNTVQVGNWHTAAHLLLDAWLAAQLAILGFAAGLSCQTGALMPTFQQLGASFRLARQMVAGGPAWHIAAQHRAGLQAGRADL